MKRDAPEMEREAVETETAVVNAPNDEGRRVPMSRVARFAFALITVLYYARRITRGVAPRLK